MRLYRPEHTRALRSFYGDAAHEYSRFLEGLSSVLEKEVLLKSKEIDETAGGIASTRRILLEHGLCAMPFASHGGLSLPFGVYCVAMELVGAADAPTAMSLGIHNTVAEVVLRHGSEEQRKRVFEELISGRRLGAFALTEPSSGSDARRMSTRAVLRGSHYALNGSKMFITNGGEADTYLVFASTDKGHAALLVDAEAQGLTVSADIGKMGMRGSRTSELTFHDCSVPAENLVGEDGPAFGYAKAALDDSRIVMASVCVGIALIAFQKTLDYAHERHLFGQRLSEMQITRERIADMRTDISASRLMCLHASRLKDSGADHSSEAAQAKVMASEMAARVCDRAIQAFGGYGYTDGDIHRHWRDARLLQIGEGASEVLRMLIAGKELGETR